MAPRSCSPGSQHSDSGVSSWGSERSGFSKSSAPTSFGFISRPSSRHSEFAHLSAVECDPSVSPDCTLDPRASSETYASTIDSYKDQTDDPPDHYVPEYQPEVCETEPVASTPPEFGELFPSSRRLCIRHDDTTLDGNMNLRVDTEVPISGGRKADFTLFHLRMYDLRNRDFSLRRYCRDSGREVCHTSRVYGKTVAERRPSLQRSVSSAFASFRSKQDGKVAAATGLKRHDSGYDSTLDEDDEAYQAEPQHWTDMSSAMPTNTTKLDFSNYAQVNVKRRGAKGSKRYSFEYWGTTYTWKRVVRKDGSFREVSYHLINDAGAVLAHAVPVPLTIAQAQQEHDKGGWVPPCSMWISDPSIFNDDTDVADVIVATGLIALVDDAIKSRFHSKRSVQFVLPVPSKSPLKMEYLGPKQLIDEVFHRRHSAT